MSDIRRIDVKRDGEWVTLDSIKEIVKGDVFRMFEADGTRHVVAVGVDEFTARSGPMKSEFSPLWSVDVEMRMGYPWSVGTGEVYDGD